ncbi:hypothetical protein UFOVP506_38 [uncultured Caudovirales phage]|uniref:Uncharacterized protein n=1 Tax=uncultured Caudovirales phage TaxID=2100421 RepID=A0A6J5MRR1_9CAUD|nr:hypothetical protein UFOVP506_38 [uncultured Caudovirales phage]
MATTTTTQQSLNPFIQDILARNYGAAQQVASIPYQAYGGPRIAQFRPAEQQGFQTAIDAATNQVGMPQLQQATDVAQRAAGYTPQQFQQDVSGFMSPFQTNVIDATMARLAQNRAERDASTRAQLASAKAFGNERRGVYEAQLAGQEDLNTAQTLADLYNRGYTQAAGFAQGLPAQQLAGAQALAGYGQQALGNQQSYAAMLQGAGQAQRGMAQQNLDLAYKDFLEQRGFPQQQLQTLLMGSQGLPSPVTQTTTAPGQSTLGQVGTAASSIGALLDLFAKGK